MKAEFFIDHIKGTILVSLFIIEAGLFSSMVWVGNSIPALFIMFIIPVCLIFLAILILRDYIIERILDLRSNESYEQRNNREISDTTPVEMKYGLDATERIK
jgi:hypothetical protein